MTRKTAEYAANSLCALMVSRRGDVDQLEEHRTGTRPSLVRFPGAAGDFFLPEVTFIAGSFKVSVHPRVQSHAFTSVRTLKIP